MKSNNDIINEFIKNNSHLKGNINSLSSQDIRKTLKSVNKGEAIAKLKSMGLSGVAQKLSDMSDDELVKIVANNPEILKKINDYLK